jgi:hypothetical protein
MKKIIILSAILFLNGCYLSAYCQTGNKDVLNKLKTFSSAHITEKAYLHFDKPYYAAGDTIYFKAYVTMGERLDLSQLSGVLHIDLINPANKIDQSIKLQLTNGLCWGDLALPDSLPKGNYRIRAYTQWMRNEENYFEQAIPVGTLYDHKIPESSTARSNISNTKSDIQFFAEAGNFINGIRSKIAFKAIGSNGLGIEAKGIVVDNTGKAVTQFIAAHLGMGYFYLEPEAGKTYRANITFADGTQSGVSLPLADTKGIALSINNDSLPKATVKIEADPVYYKENKGKDYTLLIYSGGSAITVNLKLDSMAIKLDILKRHLHTGITRVTLFSSANEPLCERLMFVQNYDQLNLDINSNKSSYRSREKVSLKLHAKTRADSVDIGHFSVSVIDENKVPVDENTETTILTNLLLTSDLKGTVEQPNYYFSNSTDEKLKELDLVMLTHGYRRFEWKQVMPDTYPPLAWQPEKGLEITGEVKNLFGKYLAQATVNLLPAQSKQLFTTVTDNKGEFAFRDMLFFDTTRFILQAANAKGRNNTKLIYTPKTSEPVSDVTMLSQDNSINLIPSVYLENNEKQQDELVKSGRRTGRMLKEVKITAIKSLAKVYPQYGMPYQVASGDKILYGGLLSVRLMGLIHFRPHFKPVLVVWNGVEMPLGFNIDEINTGSIESIEVTDAAGIDYGAVLIINTTFGIQPKDMVATGVLPIMVQGYYKAREFYSPKYESTATNPQRDLRSTIYWNPELVTDKDGKAAFEYYNADGKGNYRVVIEGMDEKGNIGRQVYRYKVE